MASAAAGEAEEAAAVAAEESIEDDIASEDDEDSMADDDSSAAGVAGLVQAATERAATAAAAIRALRTMVIDPDPYRLTLERQIRRSTCKITYAHRCYYAILTPSRKCLFHKSVITFFSNRRLFISCAP
jgi:hypothetical protein